MHLDRFNISTFERDEVISVVPIVSDAECGDDWFSIASAISGLAYNDEDIFLATEVVFGSWRALTIFRMLLSKEVHGQL